jgi:hypothetical protein
MLSEYDHAKKNVKDEKNNLRKALNELNASRESQKILQHIAEATQTIAHEQICKVVTHGLRYVGWDYSFDIEFARVRGKTEARLWFVRDGHRVGKNAVGGGPVDVAAFCLRLACLMLATPKRRRLLEADEPFKNVNGPEYQERVRELVLSLARDLDFQFIFASDNWFRVGKVIELS